MFDSKAVEELFAGPEAPGQTVADVAAQYLAIRGRKDDLESQLRDVNSALSAAEELLIRKLDEQGLSSVKLPGDVTGGKAAALSAVTVTSFRMIEAEFDKVKSWLFAHGGDDLLKETVPWQSFEAFCREVEASGGTMPECVKRTERRAIRLRMG